MSTNHVDINSAPAPCVMVIFGITGDLTKRKLIPALEELLARDDVDLHGPHTLQNKDKVGTP